MAGGISAILVSISFLLLLVLVLRRRIETNRRYHLLLKKYPGPKPLPIVGNLAEFAKSPDILSTFQTLHATYRKCVKLSLGPSQTLLSVTDRKMLAFLLTSATLLNKLPHYEFMKRWIGSGLVMTNNLQKWKAHRRKLSPTFRRENLEKFVDIFNQNCKVFVDKLSATVGADSFDVQPHVSMMTLDIICEIGMGVFINAQSNPQHEYAKNVNAMLDIIKKRTLSLVLQSEVLYFFSKLYRGELKAVKFLKTFSDDVIKRRKDLVDERPTFLDLMLKEGSFSDDEVRDEINSFMFAGYDTISTAISLTLHSLADNLHIQQRVVDELQIIFVDDKQRLPSYQDLKQMKYLEMVIKEALRLYPPVPMYGRKLQTDVVYDDVVLPNGLLILIFVYGLHRDSEIFPEPLKFDPQRFSAENTRNLPPFAFLPFSAGPRNCLGQKFVMMEMKAILSTFLRRFRVLPAVPEHRLRLVAEGVLKSTNGVNVRLEHRHF